MPASHIFEFTGAKSPKTKWKFTKGGEDWFRFAGLWRPMPQGGEAFTLLTTDPGPDVASIHNRQMVILDRRIGRDAQSRPGMRRTCCEPALPAGSLDVEQSPSPQTFPAKLGAVNSSGRW